MRILNFLSGLSVLFTTLAFAHLLHHFYVNAPHDVLHNPFFWTGMAVAIALGILSFMGGCLLLRRGR